MKLRINDVRLAFPVLFTPKAMEGGKPSFSASFIFAPKSATAAAVKAAIDQVGREKWGDKWDQVRRELIAKDRVCLHDGDAKSKYAGFDGNLYVSATSPQRPSVFDGARNPVVESDGIPYAGCYVNAIVDIWAQDNNFGRRVNAQLAGVQFARDGERFGGGGSATADDFDDVEGAPRGGGGGDAWADDGDVPF